MALHLHASLVPQIEEGAEHRTLASGRCRLLYPYCVCVNSPVPISQVPSKIDIVLAGEGSLIPILVRSEDLVRGSKEAAVIQGGGGS